MRSSNQPKLPINANWWRNGEKIKTNPTAFVHSESLESSPEVIIPIVSEENPQDLKLQKETTIDTKGNIDNSKFLRSLLLSNITEKYENICHQFNCPTSRKFVNTLNRIDAGLNDNKIDMAHYGLTNQGFKAIILSHQEFSHFSILDLQGNIISEQSLIYLTSFLMDSQITELNLSSMNLTKIGSKLISKWLSISKKIQKLYLRNNNFDDNDGDLLFSSMVINRSLQFLDVAENNFSVFCGNTIKKMIEDNDALEYLDISWNHLRLDGAFSLSRALKKNSGLKTLILNWNGFEDAGMKELASSLQENEYLEELEICCNRITDVGFAYILKSLEKNTILKILKIGWNSISQDAAEKSLESLKNGVIKGCSLSILDFTNIIYRRTFKDVVDSLKEIRPDFKCVYGYQDSYGKRKLESYDPVAEALNFLKTYLEKNNINLVELFEKFDVDKSMSVTYEEFREGLKEAKIPLNNTQINQLIKYLDDDGDGEIDFSELVIGADRHVCKTPQQINEAEEMIKE